MVVPFKKSGAFEDDVRSLWNSASGAVSQGWNNISEGTRNLFSASPNGSAASLLTPEHHRTLEVDAQRKAIRDILATLGMGAAVGVGARGLAGAGNFFGRTPSDVSRSPGPSVLQIPVPVYANPRDEERARRLGLKAANWKAASPWWTLPGLVAAGGGGIYGGYKTMDFLMQNKRKADLEAEIAAARDRYHRALIDQYNPANVPSAEQVPTLDKRSELLRDLGKAVDTIQEAAADFGKQADWKDNTIGLLATIGGLLAGGAGMASYNWAKSRSTQKLLEDAIKARERERYARRPPEIYAVPQPVRLSRAGGLSPIGPRHDLENPTLLGG